MRELHRAGYPWVHAKPNKDGRYITVKDGSLYQVTSFAEGENTWDLETPEMHPDVGRAMGAYHRYQETSSFDAQLAVHDFIGITLNGLENRRKELLTFAVDRKPPIEAIDEAIDRFRAITPTLITLPSVLIHMDLSKGNVLFKNGRLSAIIDFEAFFAPFILDIGITGLYWAIPFDRETSDTRVDPGRLKTLLESYAEERSLGQDKILALKDAFVWCQIRKWSAQPAYTEGMGDFSPPLSLRCLPVLFRSRQRLAGIVFRLTRVDRTRVVCCFPQDEGSWDSESARGDHSRVLILLSGEFAWIVVIANAIALPVIFYAPDAWLNGLAYRVSVGATPAVFEHRSDDRS